MARPQNDLRAVITCKTNLGKGDSLKHTTDNHLQFITGQIFIKVESIKDANRKKLHLIINPEIRTRDEITTYRFDDLHIMRVFVEEVV